MKIGIDARAASIGFKGGLNTYVICLITNLAKIDKKNLYILYTDREFDRKDLVDQPNFAFKVVRPTLRLPRENLTLPYQMRRDGIDLAHFPTNAAPICYPGRYVITIHDTWTRERDALLNAGLRTKARHQYEAVLSALFVRRATLVVTVSNYSEGSILRSFDVRPEKVRAVYNAAGITPLADPPDQQGQAIPGLGEHERFILSLGSASPRKNLRKMIEAFVYFRKEYASDYSLVLATSDGARLEQLWGADGKTDFGDRIVVLPRVSDAVLKVLYRAASLFICPSVYEGFGLPVLEAMAFGVPVLCSDRTALPEVVGDAGLLVDPLDIAQMAHSMHRLLTDTGLRQKCIYRGLQRCRQFSWEEAARQTLAVYEEASGLWRS